MDKPTLIERCKFYTENYHKTQILLKKDKEKIKRLHRDFDREREQIYKDLIRQAKALAQLQKFIINSQEELGGLANTLIKFVDEGLGEQREDFVMPKNKREGWRRKRRKK